MDDLISRQAAIDALIAEGRNVDSRYLESERIIHESDAVEAISMLPSAQRPSGYCMPFEDVAQMMSNLFGECACDVNGNDEWLPQACKYAETECPNPKEKNGCWMQFLIQGGADMRGEQDE